MWWRRNTTWSQYSWCTVSMSFYFEKESVRAAKNEHSARKTFVLQQCIMHHSLNKVNSYQRLNKTHPGCWQFPTRFSMHHYLSACGKRRIINELPLRLVLDCSISQEMDHVSSTVCHFQWSPHCINFWSCCCPCHQKSRPALKMNEFAGCTSVWTPL